jgi:hypothetical protein
VLDASVYVVSSDGKGKKTRAPYYWCYSSKQRHSKKAVVTLFLRLPFGIYPS